MNAAVSAEQPSQTTGERSACDLRGSAGGAGAEHLRSVDDDALMCLLLAAVHPRDIDELFGELYSRYYLRVNGWCRRFMRDPERANDTTQEVFMRAFRYRHSFRGESRTSTWLFSVTRNYCLTAIRKANAEPSTGALMLDPRLKGAAGQEIQQQLEDDQAISASWNLLCRVLTPTEVRVLMLHFGYDLPLALVTRQLGLKNPSGAKAFIVNAKRKLGRVVARNGRKPERGAMAA